MCLTPIALVANFKAGPEQQRRRTVAAAKSSSGAAEAGAAPSCAEAEMEARGTAASATGAVRGQQPREALLVQCMSSCSAISQYSELSCHYISLQSCKMQCAISLVIQQCSLCKAEVSHACMEVVAIGRLLAS